MIEYLPILLSPSYEAHCSKSYVQLHPNFYKVLASIGSGKIMKPTLPYKKAVHVEGKTILLTADGVLNGVDALVLDIVAAVLHVYAITNEGKAYVAYKHTSYEFNLVKCPVAIREVYYIAYCALMLDEEGGLWIIDDELLCRRVEGLGKVESITAYYDKIYVKEIDGVWGNVCLDEYLSIAVFLPLPSFVDKVKVHRGDFSEETVVTATFKGKEDLFYL